MKVLIGLMQASFCSLVVLLNLQLAYATNDQQAESSEKTAAAIVTSVINSGGIVLSELFFADKELPSVLSGTAADKIVKFVGNKLPKFDWTTADTFSLAITGRLTSPPSEEGTIEKVAGDIASYILTSALISCLPLIGNPPVYAMCIVLIVGDKVFIDVIYWYAKNYLCGNSDNCKLQSLDLSRDFAMGMVTGGVPAEIKLLAPIKQLFKALETGWGFVVIDAELGMVDTAVTSFKSFWEKARKQIESWSSSSTEDKSKKFQISDNFQQHEVKTEKP